MFPECLALIYARILSDRDGDQLGVRRQLADCEALAERKGWAIVERYVDDDVSAYSGRVRPAYRRMLEDLDAGIVEALIVSALGSPPSSTSRARGVLRSLRPGRVRHMASVTGDVDLATDDGQFMARILGRPSPGRRATRKSRRITRKHQELAQAGRIAGGGTRGYGYEQDRRTIRADEAAVIRECAERFLAGESIR